MVSVVADSIHGKRSCEIDSLFFRGHRLNCRVHHFCLTGRTFSSFGGVDAIHVGISAESCKFRVACEDGDVEAADEGEVERIGRSSL